MQWFAKDVQDLHIETIINLLNHKNRYSGKRYADDPALSYVEIQNEENIFFYTFLRTFQKIPTYHRLLAKQFSEWLEKKYKTQPGLIAAWGVSSINTFRYEGGLHEENLGKKNITPILTPWLYDNHRDTEHRGRRLRDTAEFLLKKQDEYFIRAINAIRATGYKGGIVTSNWQAGNKGAHFLNLLSDMRGTVIDRHNYSGGAIGPPGYTVESGHTLHNHTMLDKPGSGLLSTGMQQVKNYPFIVSEWLSVVPTEWAAADTTIMATYCFGLQGWDASYHFASDKHKFTDTLQFQGNGKFNTSHPVGIGLYPILARMVLRGDIKEADTIATRRLNKQQALDNAYDFDNTVEQAHDSKSFSGTPHHNALAVGKVLIEFTEGPGKSTIKDWRKKYQIKNNDGSKTISSSTGQLKWTYSDKNHQGFVEINSDGTQGILGFHPQRKFQLQDVAITPQSNYSVIMVTAQAQDKVINTDNNILLMAIARAHNTDMNIAGSLIANVGTAPIILEPVKATIKFKRKQCTVIVLDHDGKFE